MFAFGDLQYALPIATVKLYNYYHQIEKNVWLCAFVRYAQVLEFYSTYFMEHAG